jgi:imidazolonepropionase-like amidohydrolase
MGGGACEEIDATGQTVMPGLIEGHVHLNFTYPKNSNEIDMKYPPVFIGMTALRHAGQLLEAGYTGAVSGGSQFAVDAWVKRAIRTGIGRGPRLLACGPEITTTGGVVDWHPSCLDRLSSRVMMCRQEGANGSAGPARTHSRNP